MSDEAFEETWLPPGIAAKMLYCSEQTLRDMEARGELSCAERSPKGHRRYRLSEVEAIRSRLKADKAPSA